MVDPSAASDLDEPRDRHGTPANEKDLCEVADSNLARAEKAIVGSAGGALAPHAAWNHVQRPARLDVVERRFAMTKAEHALLGKNGFVVMEKRAYSTYAWALHDVYQSELPIYVSADAILHAVFASNDHLLAKIETDLLVPLLGRSLSAMHCALADAAKAYPAEVARDLDLYLTVARSLLADAPVPSVLGTDAEAAKRFADAKRASGIATVELFGRDRLIDWSQYEPRGHYAKPAPPKEEGEDASASAPASGRRGVRAFAHGVFSRGDVALAHRDEPRVAFVAELVAVAGPGSARDASRGDRCRCARRSRRARARGG